MTEEKKISRPGDSRGKVCGRARAGRAPPPARIVGQKVVSGRKIWPATGSPRTFLWESFSIQFFRIKIPLVIPHSVLSVIRGTPASQGSLACERIHQLTCNAGRMTVGRWAESSYGL